MSINIFPKIAGDFLLISKVHDKYLWDAIASEKLPTLSIKISNWKDDIRYSFSLRSGENFENSYKKVRFNSLKVIETFKIYEKIRKYVFPRVR